MIVATTARVVPSSTAIVFERTLVTKTRLRVESTATTDGPAPATIEVTWERPASAAPVNRKATSTQTTTEARRMSLAGDAPRWGRLVRLVAVVGRADPGDD